MIFECPASERFEAPALEFDAVESRILRACKTIRAWPDKERRGVTGAGIWRQAVTDWSESGFEDYVPRFQPSGFDSGDCLDALEWLRGISPPSFRLIWWRSFDVSFVKIAGKIGRCERTARRRYEEAICGVWMTARAQAKSRLVSIPIRAHGTPARHEAE
jgi:Domain of unknown function (DUF6362)